ncbi:hypothetical protein [Burkholderia ubonensis]|uniref:hypothetical protein n=1 Tax=Burkholderia ubonensis TaxID=101571 RepID=UPI001160B204|nr:hypothetical protein [Burkholderia ubonensis]
MTTLLVGVGLGVFVSALLLVAAFDLGQRACRKRKHWPTQSRRGTTMFKNAQVTVDGKKYSVCFDARTGEPLKIDVLVRRSHGDYFREIWHANKNVPLTSERILIVQAAHDALESAA